MSEVDSSTVVEDYFIYFVENCPRNITIYRGKFYDETWENDTYTNSGFRLKVYRMFMKWLEHKNILVKRSTDARDYDLVLTDYENLNTRDQWVLAQLIYEKSRAKQFRFVTDERAPHSNDLLALFDTLWRWVTFNDLVEPAKYDYVEKTGLDKVGYSSGGLGVALMGTFAPLGLTGVIPGVLGIIFTSLGGLFALGGVPLYMKRTRTSPGVTGKILMSDKGKKWVIDSKSENDN